MSPVCLNKGSLL